MLVRTSLSAALSAALLASCASTQSKDHDVSNATAPADGSSPAATENPLFVESPLPYGYPAFDRIRPEHFLPAFERGMEEQLAEVAAIAQQAEPPTFENTIVALEKSGALLKGASYVFFGLVAAHTNDTLEEIQSELAPRLAAHEDAILLNDALYARVKAVYDARETLNLDPESKRLVEIWHRDFVLAGANLSPEEKQYLKDLNAELAALETSFSQNVLKEVNELAIVVDSREELAGLPEGSLRAAELAAKERGLEGKLVVTLLNTSGQPPLSSLANRELRKRILEASLSRGSRGGRYDNREVLARAATLRAEKAQLLGYPNFAAYALETQTARTTQAVNERLATLAPAAVANAKRELEDLKKMAAKDGTKDFGPWDWSYYAEKVRAERYSFDASVLRPYFELNNVLQNGVFYAATRLFGITFQERHDLPTYQEDVRVFEVFEEDGTPLALFLLDPYARPSKRGGAWMNAYVPQSHLLGKKPVVGNHLNIPKPAEGEPALLTFDEVTTLFHEFGHALHGMFSDVRYPLLAGTRVPRDFVEYPSQVNEMWAVWPEVLANYAKHYQTGEPMPKELLDKVLALETFNQGFATLEYLAASLLDQAWHQLTPDQVPTPDDVVAFEEQALERAGVKMAEVPPRYRSTYFSHIMGGYAAGYYSYIWSEVLDADTVEWFKENGGLKRENGEHFRRKLLSRGNSDDTMSIYRQFRGKDPSIEPLLKRRGLVLPSKAVKKKS